MEVWNHETNRRRCQGCGSYVSAAFRRVYSETGRVDACPDCATYRELSERAGGNP